MQKNKKAKKKRRIQAARKSGENPKDLDETRM